MTRHLGCFGVLILWAAVLPAVGQAQEDQASPEVRAHFAQGEAHYENENYALAAEAFQQVYDLLEGHRNRGVVLYNIARAQDRAGRFDIAMANYRRFLTEAPADAPNRDRARTRIQELEHRAAGATATSDDHVASSPQTTVSTEPSIVNWIVAGALIAVAVPAIAVPMWTVATQGECVVQDELGCLEQVGFAAIDGVGLGLGIAAIVGAIVFAAGQPIQTQVHVSQDSAYITVAARF